MLSVITPSVRSEFLEIVYKCLKRQTFKDFEWIIIGPAKTIISCRFKYNPSLVNHGFDFNEIEEPDRKAGDYYNLNKAWNEAFRQAKGELIVSVVDGLWFPPDTLQRLWDHYQADPKSCVTTIGHQYDKMENGRPEHMVWRDPRARADFGSFYEVGHNEMELCVASFPRQAVIDVGGVDEEFDKYAALSEKEMMARIYKAGYTLWIDQTIEYKAISHPRLSPEWDLRFQNGCNYYNKCIKEIEQNSRLSLDFLKDGD